MKQETTMPEFLTREAGPIPSIIAIVMFVSTIYLVVAS